MDENIRLTEEASPTNEDLNEDVECILYGEVFTEVVNDDVEKIQNIMKRIGARKNMIIKKYWGFFVRHTISFKSLECLKFFLELRNNFKDSHPELFTDQLNGLVDEEFDHQNIFHMLAKQQKVSKVVKILEEYFESPQVFINRTDDTGSTPLLLAVERNNEEVARYLVRSGAHFDKDIRGQSPINIAVMNGQIDVLNEMLEMPLCEHQTTSEMFGNFKLFGEGHTILYPAAASGKDSVFSLLLQKMGEQDENSYLKKEIEHPTESENFLRHIISSGMIRTMKKLINVADEFVFGLKTKTGTSLIWAVEGHQMEIINLILENKRAMEIMKLDDENGRNVFHYAAKVNKPEILERLMQTGYSELYHKKDSEGCSPLHYAAVEGLPENVELLLTDDVKMNKESIFHCKTCVGKSKYEILERILLRFKENDKDYPCFLENQNKMGQGTPLHIAASAGRTDIVKLLLEKGASIEISTSDNGTALHSAVIGNSLSTVKYLVQEYPQIVNWRSDYDHTAATIAAANGQAEILKYLLENEGKVFGKCSKNLLDCVTSGGDTSNFTDTAFEIIKFCVKDGKLDLLQKAMSNAKYGSEEIMSKLVRKMPDVALEILNRCLTEESCRFFWGTRPVYHFFPIQGDGKDLKVINTMIEYKRHNCLAHPVVVKFLDEKWNHSNARIWYFFNVILYAIFLLSMTTYIGLQVEGSYKPTSPGLIALSVVSVVIILCNAFKEVVEIVFTWKDYFFDPNNYLEWMMYISAVIYLIPLSENKTKARTEAGAIAVLLAWINFVWFFKRLSLFGIYIIMAKKVFTSLLKVLPMVFLFIFGFSMAFFALMSNDEGFQNIPISMLTTSVMMAGEMDYRGVFLGNDKGPHIFLGRFFLICFLAIITIVIMNLLVGIAVGDIDEIMKRSKSEKRLHKASLIVSLQRSLSRISWIALKDVEDPLKMPPKIFINRKSWLIKLWEKMYKDNEVDDVDENQMILSRLEKMETLLAEISKKMNISIGENENAV